MNLLCYGASVTAQKFETGYFQHLCESTLSEVYTNIERVTFGASQYEYAGYAFISDVLAKKPDVCVIDWLTPGMKGFNQYKISLLNKALVAQNCLPVWVFFPRTNNFDDLPEAFWQVKKDAENFNVPFINLLDHMHDFKEDPAKYLRDAVHSTKEGAAIYSKTIVESLLDINLKVKLEEAKQSQGFQDAMDMDYQVPLVLKVNKSINNDSSIEISFDWLGGLFEMFFDTTVGPHVPLLNFCVYRDGEKEFDERINPADPWCFYQRAMVVETLRKRLLKGTYRVVVSKLDENPFLEKQTKKPIDVEVADSDRYLDIKRISMNSLAIIN
ncbi:MAG: hypothetical protein ACJAS1_006822 [Oleiphilaceae bacterium]|jgi:hypothetical protein